MCIFHNQHTFNPPYISNDKKGMGLGIFISKNLIENIGGSVYFTNNKKGASVQIIVDINKLIV